MIELGIFESYRSVDSDGICYVRGINRIQDYNTPLYNKFFKIKISEGIIFVDKYVNRHFEGTVQCANRFGFEELTIKEK